MAYSKSKKRYSRPELESDAVRYAEMAKSEIRLIGCSDVSAQKLAKASRYAGMARTKLTSIGHHESKRTMRLWAIVQKADKAVQAKLDAFARSCSISGKQLLGLGAHRARRSK